MRLRGLNRLVWEWCCRRAEANKRSFARELAGENLDFLRLENAATAAAPEVISFCGAHDFPEQVLSILTFHAHVGVPERWTVYSDGSLGPGQDRILRALPFPVLRVDWYSAAAASSVRDEAALYAYAEAHPLGKKYFAISHHWTGRPVLYADSDLLFYPRGRHLPALAADGGSHYLADIPDAAALDQGLPEHLVSGPHQVNSGLLIIPPGFVWAAGHDYLADKTGHWGYFSEQTAIHIAMLANNARRLDPAQFVVSVRDQFAWRQGFRLEELAARHYVKLVRHLVWRDGWKSHFPTGAGPRR